jgi:cysteine desulfurase
MARIYLDNNATTPIHPEVLEVLDESLRGVYGNASSIHKEGQLARRVLEEGRESVAELIGAAARDIVFTSGGTESNNAAIFGAVAAGGRHHIVTTAIEHPSVLEAAAELERREHRLTRVPPRRDGLVVAEAVLAAIEPETRLVAMMLANNETGVIQPVAAAAELVHRAGGLLHVDAVQAAGKIPFNINDLGADLVTLSAHKLGGPKGVGALIKRDEALHLTQPLIRGGGQERGVRGGTENVPGIAGFGAAAEAARSAATEESARATALRDRIEAGVMAASPSVVIFGREAQRLPNTTLFAMPGLKAETALIALDLDGVAVSSGSACSSGKVAASPVLTAMGIEADLARGAIRVSVGFSTSDEEVDCFLNAWKKLVSTLFKGTHGMAA